MSFLYPAFLWALALLAIPVIIHLFNFRRYKTVYFSNVRFLKSINDETTNRSRLKHLLVLAARLLFVAFLVFAFAQPFIPVKDSGAAASSEKLVSIYVDNSFSMNAVAAEEPLLQLAQKKALEISKAYNENTRFQLVTNNFEPRQQRTVLRDDFKTMLDEIKPTPVVRTLSEVQSFQQKLRDDFQGQATAYWLSDFQKNIVDVQPDTTTQTFLVPLQAVQEQNIFIDSCWLEKPVLFVNEPNQLLYRIGNSGNSDALNVRVTMSINEQVKGLTEVTVPTRSAIIDTLSFSIQDYGWQKIKVFVNDFPITFDDQYFLTFKTNELIRVLAINEQQESNFLKALFFEQKNYRLDNMNASALESAALSDYNLVILNNLNNISSALSSALENYLRGGGSVLLFPSEKADVMSYNRFLSITGANEISEKSVGQNEVSYLNINSELFSDVFEKVPDNLSLPKTKLYYTFVRKTRSSEQVVLGLKNNASFLSQYNFQSGKLVVCASPLGKDYSDFPVHSIFVPLIYKMSVTSSAKLNTSYILGKDPQIEIAERTLATDAVYKIRNENIEWIPGQRNFGGKVFLDLDADITEAGFFEVFNEKTNSSHWVALNFNRQESETQTYTTEELEARFAGSRVEILDALKTNFAEAIEQINRGIALWKVCIILALVFLAAEILLLRFLK